MAEHPGQAGVGRRGGQPGGGVDRHQAPRRRTRGNRSAARRPCGRWWPWRTAGWQGRPDSAAARSGRRRPGPSAPPRAGPVGEPGHVGRVGPDRGRGQPAHRPAVGVDLPGHRDSVPGAGPPGRVSPRARAGAASDRRRDRRGLSSTPEPARPPTREGIVRAVAWPPEQRGVRTAAAGPVRRSRPKGEHDRSHRPPLVSGPRGRHRGRHRHRGHLGWPAGRLRARAPDRAPHQARGSHRHPTRTGSRRPRPRRAAR